MNIVLMGPSGCGKTTIGRLLSESLGLPFIEGDEFHPRKNIEKMRAGIGLTDKDRMPWLERLAQELSAGGGSCLACSALKGSYRERLRRADKDIIFVYLKGDKNTLKSRLEKRQGHFFNPKLLDSQLDILEEPKESITIDIDSNPTNICRQIVLALR